MVKRCVWAIAIGLVLLGGAWNSAVGQDYDAHDLTKLKSLCVHTHVHASATRDHNLSEKAIKNHIYVWLKGKLPRLRIGRFTGEYRGVCSLFKPLLYTDVNIGSATIGEKKVGHFGYVLISMTRETTWKSGKAGSGIAFLGVTSLAGPMGETRTHVIDALEEILTDFAAEYYKAGNP